MTASREAWLNAALAGTCSTPKETKSEVAQGEACHDLHMAKQPGLGSVKPRLCHCEARCIHVSSVGRWRLYHPLADAASLRQFSACPMTKILLACVSSEISEHDMILNEGC